MTNSEKAFPLWAGLFTLIFFFGCVPQGKVYRVKPARVGWQAIHNVAVLGFDGPYGENLRRQVFHRLAEVQYFNPKDTSQNPALSHVSYDKAGDYEFFHAIEDLGVDVVITGRVSVHVHDAPGVDQVEVKEGTGYYKKEKDASGQWVDVEIKRTVIRPIPYVMREARLESEFKVWDVLRRVVVAAGEVTEAERGKFGGDKEYASSGHALSNLPTSSATADGLSARTAAKLIARLSRMKLAGVLKLDETGGATVKQGVALAKSGHWKEAMQIWEQVIRNEPGQAAAYYNLGVAREGLGTVEDLKTARDLYKRAAALGTNRLYTDGILRVDRVIGDSRIE